MKRSAIWARLGLCLLLALGVAALWGVAGGMAVQRWENWSRTTRYEQLAIRHNGEPMLERYSTVGGVFEQLPQRTLDGKEIPGPNYNGLDAAYLQGPPKPRTWGDGPVTWGERIARTDQAGRWIMIHDGAAQGRAYLARYDMTSKLPAGYIGRDGFRLNPPAADEMFEVGPPFSNRASRITGAGLFIFNVRRWSVEADSATPLWCIYLLDGDDLVEIDLSARAVRTLIDSAGAQSLAIAAQPAPGAEEEISMMSINSWTGPVRKEPVTERLMVRLPESVAVLNPRDDQRVDFRLPAEFRERDLRVYLLSDEQLLIKRQTPAGPGRQRHELTWLNNAGERVRELTVELDAYRPTSDRAWAIAATLVVPSILFFAVMMLGLAPASEMATGEAVTYGEAFREALAAAWPAGAGLLVVSIAAAWLVVRWQRRYDRSHTAIWATAVFLLGVPGLLAYMIHHGWPPLTSCPACGQRTPRRRDDCARCRAPFPAPGSTGTEVFAS